MGSIIYISFLANNMFTTVAIDSTNINVKYILGVTISLLHIYEV